MWQPPPAYPLAPDAYPVNISYDRSASINRLWGIPLIGQAIRWLLLIPHFLILMLIGIFAFLLMFITWIPVLLLGRFPGWGYRWIGGTMAWSTRVQAYAGLLTAVYPPFSLEGEDHPVSVRFDEGVRINRLWGIPLIGQLVRFVLLIPHFIVLMLLAFVVIDPDLLRLGAGAFPGPPGRPYLHHRRWLLSVVVPRYRLPAADG